MIVRNFLTSFLVCGLLVRVTAADPIFYQQVQQDRQKQLAGQTVAPVPAGQKPGQTLPSQEQATGESDQPKFVRLPDGRIVAYGPGVICTENCVEPFEARAPSRPRMLVWGLPIIAGGLLAGLVGSRVIGGGPVARASIAPSPTPTVDATPLPSPTPSPSPTPKAEVPEPATLVLLGIGMTVLMRRRKRNNNS